VAINAALMTSREREKREERKVSLILSLKREEKREKENYYLRSK